MPSFEQTSARDLADAGFERADAGSSAEALRHFERALELDPRCAAAWAGKGMQLQGEAALACFDQAIGAMPDYDGAWFLKSVVLGELGRANEAASCLARARALSPGTYG
ncbi:MAG TPA: tetratricopeptide repeat protein [Kofleriaceae bacterium]